MSRECKIGREPRWDSGGVLVGLEGLQKESGVGAQLYMHVRSGATCMSVYTCT